MEYRTIYVNTIGCTGCGRRIPVGFRDHRLIQCKECGRKMHVLTLTPAGEHNKAV